jgi:V8-like Glu-specific endopeptidase
MSAWRGVPAGRIATRILIALAAAVTGVAASAPVRTVAETRVLVAPYGEVSPVGALFALTSSGQLGRHFCTASVVNSADGDLLLTAAHCLRDHVAAQLAFVPGYRAGHWADGVWRVSSVLVDQRWQAEADPDDDFAFLIVHDSGHRASLETVTGAEDIAVGVPAGLRVEVAGYPDDGSGMVSCDNTAGAFSATQFMFRCEGFSDGTSGGPLLADVSPADGLDTVIGVIGGYQLGGRSASVSYAARFSGQLGALYQEALSAADRR